ncbi:MAG: MBOAT family O-acyltransferase [Bacillota bacterium]
MIFATIHFFILITSCVFFYYLVPVKYKWCVLLLANTIFYITNGGRTIVWLFAVIGTTYLSARILDQLNVAIKEVPKAEKEKKLQLKKQKKFTVTCTLILCVGLLYMMKYWNFTISFFPSLPLPRFDFLIPLGLSFFTFQAIGYVIDVYRGKYAAQKNILKYACFVSFFPQMIQGPIGRYNELLLFEENRFSYKNMQYGLQLMLLGFIKKLVVADRAAVMVNAIIFDGTPYSGAIVAVGIFFYCIQLYYDFSGGVDVARGVATLFGITMAENFKRPIFATSLADYWRRWHISLGTWMRDYLFYSLSLSKPFGKLSKWARKNIKGIVGKIFATSVATFIVYFIIGVWHGASMKYVAFGFYNGTLLTLSLIFESKFVALKKALHIDDHDIKYKLFCIVRTWGIIFIGRYLSRADGLMHALRLLKRTVLDFQPSTLFSTDYLSFGLQPIDFMVILSCLLPLLFMEFLQEKGMQIRDTLSEKNLLIQWVAIAVPLFVLVFFGFYNGDYIASEFIYAQF